jgi:hypothetical protein
MRTSCTLACATARDVCDVVTTEGTRTVIVACAHTCAYLAYADGGPCPSEQPGSAQAKAPDSCGGQGGSALRASECRNGRARPRSRRAAGTCAPACMHLRLYVHSRHIRLESSTHLVCATRTYRTRRVRSKAVCITCTPVRATRTYMCNVMTKVRHTYVHTLHARTGGPALRISRAWSKPRLPIAPRDGAAARLKRQRAGWTCTGGKT